MIRRWWWYRLGYEVRSLPGLVRQAYQRARYGGSDRDCWNLSSYVCRVLHRGIGWFIAQDGGMGYPVDMTHEEWVACLRTMHAFLGRVIDEEHRLDIENTAWEGGFKLVNERLWDLWD